MIRSNKLWTRQVPVFHSLSSVLQSCLQLSFGNAKLYSSRLNNLYTEIITYNEIWSAWLRRFMKIVVVLRSYVLITKTNIHKGVYCRWLILLFWLTFGFCPRILHKSFFYSKEKKIRLWSIKIKLWILSELVNQYLRT